MATNTANYAMIKPSYADIADVAAINQNTDKIDEIMHGSQTSIADAYDPAETYAAGDLAMHDFQLYKCNTDDTTGTWDPTKWERTTAAAEGGGGGGSAVSITPTLSTGTKIADFEVDGVPGKLYAPTGGGGGGSDSHDYDNTEKIVGTYFGKTLYEKSYQNIAGTGTAVNVTLSDLSNIETIFIVPEASASTDVIPFPYVHYDPANLIGAFFAISNGVPTLSVRRGSSSASFGLKYLTVRYTKLTT